MTWFKRFDRPVKLPDQRSLLTLRDAAEYIAALPAAERDSARWRLALESLALAAHTKNCIELACTAVRLALNPVSADPSGRIGECMPNSRASTLPQSSRPF